VRSILILYAVEWTLRRKSKGFMNDIHYFTFAKARLRNSDTDETDDTIAPQRADAGEGSKASIRTFGSTNRFL